MASVVMARSGGATGKRTAPSCDGAAWQTTKFVWSRFNVTSFPLGSIACLSRSIARRGPNLFNGGRPNLRYIAMSFFAGGRRMEFTLLFLAAAIVMLAAWRG